MTRISVDFDDYIGLRGRDEQFRRALEMIADGPKYETDDPLGWAKLVARNALASDWNGHDSDCALHNEPASPNGPCDCSRAAIAKALNGAGA